MKFHKEALQLNLSRHRNKIILGLSIAFFAIITAANIRGYLNIKETVPVVMTKGILARNQLVTDEYVQQYDMTRAEFERYALEKSYAGTTNRVVLWRDKDTIVGKKYANHTLLNGNILLYKDLVDSYKDMSRLAFYNFPGKDLVELNLSGTNLNTFKKKLEVGDKINVDIYYKTTLTSAVVKSSIKRKSTSESYFDYDLMKIDSVFVGLEIADILNSNGDSLLDYMEYVNGLSVQEKIQLEQTEEYKENIKASTILVALTPAEKDLYNMYKKKDGATLFISLPQAQ